MKTAATHNLAWPIVRETQIPGQDEVHEEELKPAGFCVVLRRPKAKHMKVLDAYDNREIEGLIAMLGKISNLTAEEIDNLDGADFGELGNVVGSLVNSGPATGATV